MWEDLTVIKWISAYKEALYSWHYNETQFHNGLTLFIYLSWDSYIIGTRWNLPVLEQNTTKIHFTCRRGGVALWRRSIHTIMRLRWGVPKTCRVSPHSSLSLGVWRGGNITLLTHPTVIPLSFQSGTKKGWTGIEERGELELLYVCNLTFPSNFIRFVGLKQKYTWTFNFEVISVASGPILSIVEKEVHFSILWKRVLIVERIYLSANWM